MATYSDNAPYSIESAKRLYVEYSAGIDFDYSNGKYPSGNEEDWNWELVFIPISHYYKGNQVKGHTHRREKIGKEGKWSLPVKIVGDNGVFKIDQSGDILPSSEDKLDGYTFLNEPTGQIYIVKDSAWTGPFNWRGQTSGIFYKQDTQPTGIYVGDTWNNTSNDTLWRFDGTSWVLIELSGSVQNLSHTELLASSIGSNTHAQIDSHISNTDNPHSVTANQILPTQTSNNGKYLQTDGSNVSWQDVPPGYTDEEAQDAVGNAVGAGLDYDDNTGAISVDITEVPLSADNIWIGNVSNIATEFAIKKSLSGVTNLVAGSVNIADAAITASSIVYCSVGDGTYNGKIRYSANIGYVTFYTGDAGDNADVSYMIINP